MDPIQFDSSTAFDAAEALNVLAHDYGMYAIKERLNAIPFRAAPGREDYETLDDEGRMFYDDWTDNAANTDPYEVPEWAETVLAAIDANPQD